MSSSFLTFVINHKFSSECTRYPFNWKTPFGYLLAFLSQYIGIGVAVGGVYLQFFNLIVGSSWFFIFIAKEITKDLSTVNIHVTFLFHWQNVFMTSCKLIWRRNSKNKNARIQTLFILTQIQWDHSKFTDSFWNSIKFSNIHSLCI